MRMLAVAAAESFSGQISCTCGFAFLDVFATPSHVYGLKNTAATAVALAAATNGELLANCFARCADDDVTS